MEEDRELQAMSNVNTALKGLSEEERYRVMQWAANKYLQNSAPLKLAGPAARVASEQVGTIDANVVADAEEGAGQDLDEGQPFATFAEMLDASGASKDTERFLVAAYWLQGVNDKPTWKSFEVNKLLKDTGNRIAAITAPVRVLSGEKPALVVQVSKKSSSSGKGSKILKLTSEGVKKAKAMLGQA